MSAIFILLVVTGQCKNIC